MAEATQNQGVDAVREKYRARPKKEPKPKKKVEKAAPPPKEEKNWDKTSIQELLARNDKAICRAVVAIFERQDQDEQEEEQTKSLNNRGFNQKDAKIMTSIAKWYLEKGWLSPKQMRVARNRMPKYWRQLLEVAEQKTGGSDG